MMSRQGQPLDPRMLPRGFWLDRLGAKRPAVSVVDLNGSLGEDRRQVIAGFAARSGSQVQTLSPKTGGAPKGAGARDNPVVLANRLASAATGRLLVLLLSPVGVEAALAMLQRFSDEQWLGTIAVKGPDEIVAALIVREGVWSALSGLETAYHDLTWALKDFCQRAAAIGYAVDCMPIAARDGGADAVFFRRRAAAAPPRVPAVGTETLPSRAGRTVYTAITDSYDTLKLQPSESIGDWWQVAFLDVRSRSALGSRLNGWTAADIGAIGGSDLSDPHRLSRFPKINAHLALPDTAFSLWVDASIGIVAPLPVGRLVELFLGDSDICVFRHGQQQTVEEEAETCKWFGLDRPETIDAQMGRYRAAGFPDEEPLAELPVILRRHSPAMRAFNEAWWTEVVNGSRRDQLSFNYVAWKLGVRYATFPLSVAAGNGLFLKFRRSSLDPTV